MISQADYQLDLGLPTGPCKDLNSLAEAARSLVKALNTQHSSDKQCNEDEDLHDTLHQKLYEAVVVRKASADALAATSDLNQTLSSKMSSFDDDLETIISQLEGQYAARKQQMATKAWYCTAWTALGRVCEVIAIKLHLESWEELTMMLENEEEEACQLVQKRIYELLEKNGKSRANWDNCRSLWLESSYDYDSESCSVFIKYFRQTSSPADATRYVPDLIHLLEFADKGSAIKM